MHATQIQNQPYPHASLLQSAVEDLRRLLLQNGYPQSIIPFNINDVLNNSKEQAK